MSNDKKRSDQTITGIDVMRGIGVVRAKPFWADAWHRVIIRRGAQAGLLWIAIIGFFAIFAPLLANGLPLWTKELGPDGEVVRSFSPLFQALTATDLLLIAGGVLGPLLFLIPMGLTRQHKLGLICAAALLGGITVVLIPTMEYAIVGDEVTDLSRAAWFPWALSLGSGFAVGVVLFWMPTFKSMGARIVFALLVVLLSGAVYADRWSAPVLNPERFIRGQEEGTYENTFTLIPWSPTQSRAVFYSKPPAETAEEAYRSVADERINDGVAYFARAITFNISPHVEGMPLTRTTQGALVSLLSTDDAAAVRQLHDEGFAPRYIDLFKKIASDLSTYSKSLFSGDAEVARAASKSVVALVGELEPAGRNARITIEGAGFELSSKIADRIRYVGEAEAISTTTYGKRDFYLGTDPIGRDVLTQMLHACRLSISIGLVSTGISVLIGIFVGSLMGYFGGWVDLVLSRIVEIFMAVPVLFLLIVAASVLPRNTYVMMAIIGCVTWTGSARFIRAEFLKLRNQDFVQSCRAVGLPLHSILFRHMLPNGITPVLVQASFGVAAAIIAEATLSYLGLGPYGQASWGKLLALTTGETGVFLWWMAVFPGVAIFLTVLAYNVLGENFRDAIDPKMRKAAQ